MTDEGAGVCLHIRDAISRRRPALLPVTAGTENMGAKTSSFADILNYTGAEVLGVYVDASTGAYTLSGTGPAADRRPPPRIFLVRREFFLRRPSPGTPCGSKVPTKTAPQLIFIVPIRFRCPSRRISALAGSYLRVRKLRSLLHARLFSRQGAVFRISLRHPRWDAGPSLPAA